MRLITRADFDGIAAAVFICDMEDISEVVFAHPKDMQDGKIDVHPGDAISNLPYHPNSTLWFDHHDLAEDLPDPMPNVRGKCGVAPSAARLVYEFYNSPKLAKYEEMLKDVDRVDSATLDLDDVLDPKGWVLLSYTLDPRTALGRFREYSSWVIETIQSGMGIDEMLQMPMVKERTDLFLSDEENLKEATLSNSRLDDKVIITDFRGLEKIPAGGRFLVYALFPEGNVQVRVHWNHLKTKIVAAVGKSIFNRTCRTHVGQLMAKYDGGGLDGAGSCVIDPENVDEKIAEIVSALKG